MKWNAGIADLTRQLRQWRDQPKYKYMRLTAQLIANARPAVRASLKGDVRAIDYSSLVLSVRHLATLQGCDRLHAAAHVRSDHGTEMTARIVRDRLDRLGAKTLFIEQSGGERLLRIV